MTTANDLLRRAQKFLISCHVNHASVWPRHDLVEEIHAYLETTKDEPIGYVSRDCDGVLGSDLYYTPEEAVEDTMGTGTAEAVYLHPTKTAPMKPMTEEEITRSMDSHGYPYSDRFIQGIRAAERHHGLTLQDICRGDK